MDTITVIIDGVEVKARKGKRILEAALDNDIYIPNLCSLRDTKLPFGSCRLCWVEIEGRKGPYTACSEPARDGMVIHTSTPEVDKLRRSILKLLLSRHPNTCLTCHRRERCQPGDICLRRTKVEENHCVTCPKNGRCELQRVVDYLGIQLEEFPYQYKNLPVEAENPFVVRNNNLCILCGRCVRVCGEILGIEAIAFASRGGPTVITGAFGRTLSESGCTFCGSCVEVCPVGALMDKEDQWERWPDRKAAMIRCQYACPASIDVPRYIKFILEGKYTEALGVIRERVPFAAILGHICAHPCETQCRRSKLDQPVAIRALKRFAAEQGNAAAFDSGEKAPSSGKKVAIVGSGPAGLSAAYYLAKKGGHSVTIFESLPQPGGMLRVGIPEFRLPRKVLEAEIGIVTKLGVEIKAGTRVESVDKLFQEGYQAVFLAIGAHAATKMGIEGQDLPGVVDGLSFLRGFNLGEKVSVGQRAVVVGGGNAAFDAARVARRLGAGQVTLVCPVAREGVAVTGEEVEETLAEGVNIEFQASPSKIAAAGGALNLHYLQAETGAEGVLAADTIIVAVGQLPAAFAQMGAALQDRGTLQADPETLQTSKQGVFAGGDAIRGPSTVIQAIADGRKAAVAIDKYLGGQGNIEESFAPSPSLWVGRDEVFAQRRRVAVPLRLAEGRIKDVAPVDLGYTKEQATEEARRCMGCNRRFLVAPLVAQPERARVTVK